MDNDRSICPDCQTLLSDCGECHICMLGTFRSRIRELELKISGALIILRNRDLWGKEAINNATKILEGM